MKFLSIEGLAASGSWVSLFKLPLLDDTTKEVAAEAMNETADKLKTANYQVQLGDESRAVNFNPSNFLAIRLTLQGF